VNAAVLTIHHVFGCQSAGQLQKLSCRQKAKLHGARSSQGDREIGSSASPEFWGFEPESAARSLHGLRASSSAENDKSSHGSDLQISR
jgi:hypothetical protein